jgi:hypothetical protein
MGWLSCELFQAHDHDYDFDGEIAFARTSRLSSSHQGCFPALTAWEWNRFSEAPALLLSASLSRVPLFSFVGQALNPIPLVDQSLWTEPLVILSRTGP